MRVHGQFIVNIAFSMNYSISGLKICMSLVIEGTKFAIRIVILKLWMLFAPF